MVTAILVFKNRDGTMIKQQIRLRITQGLGQIPVSLSSLAISELSPLELEIALDNGLAELQQDYPSSESRGNYFFSSDFSRKCQGAKDRVSQAALLDNPQILVGINAEGNYTASYNLALIQRIKEKLRGFKREGDKSQREHCFSLKVKENLEWTTQQQVILVDYLVNQQAKYLKSKNPMDLKAVSLRDVGEVLGQSTSSIDRLARNLTIQLPEGKRIFAKELITANTIKQRQGIYLLRQLQKDPRIYDDGRWKTSRGQLISLLQERFRFKITDKPLTKYLRSLESQQAADC